VLSDIALNQEFGSSHWRVRAVVIGGELNGLGVCRSPALGGMLVWVVDSKRSNPALWSRYARPVLADALHGHSLVVFLRDLRRRIGERPFLVARSRPRLALSWWTASGAGTIRCRHWCIAFAMWPRAVALYLPPWLASPRRTA